VAQQGQSDELGTHHTLAAVNPDKIAPRGGMETRDDAAPGWGAEGGGRDSRRGLCRPGGRTGNVHRPMVWHQLTRNIVPAAAPCVWGSPWQPPIR